MRMLYIARINQIIFLSLFLLFWLSSCAVTKYYLSDHEKKQLGAKIYIDSTADVEVKFDAFLSTNPISGAIKGAAAGFIMGFHPIFLCVGHIFTIPYASTSFSQCYKHFKNIENSEYKFSEAIMASEPTSILRNKLNDFVAEHNYTNTIISDASTIIKIKKITVELDPALNDFSCGLVIELIVDWELKRSLDNKTLLDGKSKAGQLLSASFDDIINTNKTSLNDLLSLLFTRVAHDITYRSLE